MADTMDIDIPPHTATTKSHTKPQKVHSKPRPNGKASAAATADILDDVMDEDIDEDAEEANGDFDGSASDDADSGVDLDSDELDTAEDFSGLDSDDEPAEINEGVRLSPSLIPTTDDKNPSTASTTPTTSSVLNPSKASPYVPDPGHLLISDPNSLPPLPSATNPSAREAVIAGVARDAAQSLLNTLLTTCPIVTTSSTATSKKDTGSGSGVLMTLPPPLYQLPREKRIPALKLKTKWQRFAEKKGITKDAGRKKTSKVFDEATQEWKPRWGYRGINNSGGKGEWLVEVDETGKKREEGGGDVRKMGREERKEMVRRQGRRERRNEKGGGKR